jgi:hypothetical protein
MDPLSKVGWLGVLVHDHARRVMAASMGQLMALPRGVRGVHPGIGAMIQVLTFAVEMGFLDVVLDGPFVQFLRDVSSRSQEATIANLWIEDINVLTQTLEEEKSFHGKKSFRLSPISESNHVVVLDCRLNMDL